MSTPKVKKLVFKPNFTMQTVKESYAYHIPILFVTMWSFVEPIAWNCYILWISTILQPSVSIVFDLFLHKKYSLVWLWPHGIPILGTFLNTIENFLYWVIFKCCMGKIWNQWTHVIQNCPKQFFSTILTRIAHQNGRLTGCSIFRKIKSVDLS